MAISNGKKLIEFDFPKLKIGSVENELGPTGVTTFYFPEKAIGVVDVRGGAPGTYNTEWLKLGYDFRNLDAITIGGGSWYGLVAAGGVSAAIKKSGIRSGHWSNLANVAGAIIYDLGERRANEIHPDEALGEKSFEACESGKFFCGAAGAGRMTMQGSLFGECIHSGQGGSVRQIDKIKIGCFTVVNSVGLVVNRENEISVGNQRLEASDTSIFGLLNSFPQSLQTVPGSILGKRKITQFSQKNTTISLVVTNKKMKFHELNRLAIQVHSSMGRAIQPFGSANDGDVLFAVTTDEIDDELHPTDLGVIASEVMWDAVLASTPLYDDPLLTSFNQTMNSEIENFSGKYTFLDGNEIFLTCKAGEVELRNLSTSNIYGIKPNEAYKMKLNGQKFCGENKFLAHMILSNELGEKSVILNPGPWQYRGQITV